MISTNDMVMPVAPVGGYGSGSGFNGDWSSWIILFLIFAMFGGGFGGNGGANGNTLYPWLNQSDQINGGFRDQMINSTINGIQGSVTSGFGDVQNSLCAGFAGVNAAITNAQLSDLERSFAAQTANTQGQFALQSQLSDCCCANRIATLETKDTIANEGAATRLAIQQQTQAILDRLCEQEIENLRSQNVSLQNQVNMLNLSASQTAQTAQLIADNTAQTQYIVNRVAPYPIPSYTVANPVTPATLTTTALAKY